MYKTLIVGDPHAELTSLDEMSRLVDFIAEKGKEKEIDEFIFLGDLFHTHSVIHLPILEFWKKAFDKLTQIAPVLTLVGNHDKSGVKGSNANSMMLYDNITVVEDFLVKNNILFIGYMADHIGFVDLCNALPGVNTVICHQTFDGSKYENGFYAKDGIDQKLIPQRTIISGHIHTPQVIGKVIYPGAPRWRTISDANIDRYVWYYEFKQNGSPNEIARFPTNTACSPIYHYKDLEDSPLIYIDEEKVKNARLTVDIHGSQEYINRKINKYEELGFRVRTFPTRSFKSEIKESEGMGIAINKFLNTFKPAKGTSNERLIQLVKERIDWAK